MASHDLQEPLRKIRTFGDRLEQKWGRASRRGGTGLPRTDAGSAAGRMQALIHGLLEYSRVDHEAGADVAGRPGRPGQGGALTDLSARIAETGGSVEVGDLPVVVASPVQMRQLFQNLHRQQPEVPGRGAARDPGLGVPRPAGAAGRGAGARTTASGSTSATSTGSSSRSHGCRGGASTRGRAWAWRSAAGSSSATAAPSRRRALPGGDRRSSCGCRGSRCRPSLHRPRHERSMPRERRATTRDDPGRG